MVGGADGARAVGATLLPITLQKERETGVYSCAHSPGVRKRDRATTPPPPTALAKERDHDERSDP